MYTENYGGGPCTSSLPLIEQVPRKPSHVRPQLQDYTGGSSLGIQELFEGLSRNPMYLMFLEEHYGEPGSTPRDSLETPNPRSTGFSTETRVP